MNAEKLLNHENLVIRHYRLAEPVIRLFARDSEVEGYRLGLRGNDGWYCYYNGKKALL